LQKPEVQFLNDKPHEKGIINSIQFMPWSNGTQFATAGCDHGVVLWSEKEGSDRCWQPHLLHRVLHSSSVSGVAGIPHKQLVLSSGLDKRLFAVDLAHGKSAFQHTLESKALGVLSNPADFNLFMAQTGCISTLFCKLLFWFLNSSNLVGVHMSYCFGAPLNILMGFRIS
jgi:WD40 repeat protein